MSSGCIMWHVSGSLMIPGVLPKKKIRQYQRVATAGCPLYGCVTHDKQRAPSVCADHGGFAPRHVGVCRAITAKWSQWQELRLHEPQSVCALCRTAKTGHICQTLATCSSTLSKSQQTYTITYIEFFCMYWLWAVFLTGQGWCTERFWLPPLQTAPDSVLNNLKP